MASSVSQAQKGPRNSLKTPDKVIPPEFYYVFTTEKAEEAFRRPESIKEWPPRNDESLRFLADAADLAAASIRADEPSRFPTKWYWLDSVLNQVIRGIRAMDELDKEPWNPEWDNSDQLVYFDKLAPLKPCCQYVFGEEDAERASRSSLFLLEQQKADKCPGLLTIAARLILKDDAAGPDQFEDPLHWLDSYLATAIIQVHPELEALLDTGSEEEPSDSDDSEYMEERPLRPVIRTVQFGSRKATFCEFCTTSRLKDMSKQDTKYLEVYAKDLQETLLGREETPRWPIRAYGPNYRNPAFPVTFYRNLKTYLNIKYSMRPDKYLDKVFRQDLKDKSRSRKLFRMCTKCTMDPHVPRIGSLRTRIVPEYESGNFTGIKPACI
ncbi:hypothetical protein BDZ89DRAFT_1233198 [Hymenopellis radicata]|nr:hypothetical protein BDZ89DRAFT_1233198 [Hymenopellis radicata]